MSVKQAIDNLIAKLKTIGINAIEFNELCILISEKYVEDHKR